MAQWKRRLSLLTAAGALALGCGGDSEGDPSASRGGDAGAEPAESGGSAGQDDPTGGTAPSSGGARSGGSGGAPSGGTGGSGGSTGGAPSGGTGGSGGNTGGAPSGGTGGSGGNTGGAPSGGSGGAQMGGTGGSGGNTGGAPSGGSGSAPMGGAGGAAGDDGGAPAGAAGSSTGGTPTGGAGGAAGGVAGQGGAADLCNIPPIPGNSQCGSSPMDLYYFNVELGRCVPFAFWVGCEMNANQFSTEADCRATCGGPAPPHCDLPPYPGHCEALATRYWFDASTGRCETFTYTMCGSNGNNFESEADCLDACASGTGGAGGAGGSNPGLTPACELAGGELCTAQRWEVCPVGFEPVAGDGHQDCDRTGNGWCCQPAPESACSQTEGANCVPGECTGCWADAGEGLSCEEGRSCCVDNCW